VHAKRLDKTPAASVCGDPGVGKTVLLDQRAADSGRGTMA